MEFAHKAQQAIAAKDYSKAIDLYTTALQSTNSPLWLIERSTAYQRVNKSDLALADADNAVIAANKRAKRELIATAQLRRAIALNSLGRFGDARLCFTWCNKYNPKEKALTMWIAKNKFAFDQAGGDDAECNKTTVKEIPEPVSNNQNVEVKKTDKGKGIAASDVSVAGAKSAESVKTVNSAPPVLAPTSKDKIRHEWYQSNNTITITIFAKGVPKEEAEISIEEGELDVGFPTSSDGTYNFSVSPFFSNVDKSKSTFRITPHKIEITLSKSKPGLKWPALEGTEIIKSSTTEEDAPKIPDSVLKPTERAPAYPTSSRNGPKDWDNLGDDEKEEEGEVDDFFKKLYKDSDPDTRRAMMKSYQESGGTSLSTSWGDVANKTFKVEPPEGMEAKKWEY